MNKTLIILVSAECLPHLYLFSFFVCFQLPEEVCIQRQFTNLTTRIGCKVGCRAPSCDCAACVLFSSTQAKGKCIWRKTSSGTAAQQRVQRPSSTCGKWAPAFVFPRENTLLCPPPLSPIRMETFMCGCSQRNRLTSSMFLPQISASFYDNTRSILSDWVYSFCF